MAQYIARNVDNTPKVPQPGDVEVQDVFTNVFDNFNEYGTNAGQVRFYDVENVLKSPQPAYQNGNYKRYVVEYIYDSSGKIIGYVNNLDTNQPQADALDWIDRNVENNVITPQPYVNSPLWPDDPDQIPISLSTTTVLSPAAPAEIEAGDTLTATAATATGGKGTLVTLLQWRKLIPGEAWSNIPGATSTTLLLTQGDSGCQFLVTTRIRDNGGNEPYQELYSQSAASSVVTGDTVPLTYEGNVKLGGDIAIGGTVVPYDLPVWSGGIEPITYEYQYLKSADGSSWGGWGGWQALTYPYPADVSTQLSKVITDPPFSGGWSIKMQIKGTDPNGTSTISVGLPYAVGPEGIPNVDPVPLIGSSMEISLSLNGYPDGQAILVSEDDISAVNLIGVFDLLSQDEQKELIEEWQVIGGNNDPVV